MNKVILITAFIFIFVSAWCQEKVDERDLLELKSRMEGFFTSELQAKTDTSYFNIHLHTAPIWQRSEDGYWIYVEQAIASDLKNPYRQRIYHLYRQDDFTLVSKAFELNDPLRFAGAYDNPDLLKGITKDSLIDRKGCAIYLQKNAEGNFIGSTSDNQCLSSLRGAMYVTSNVTIYEDRVISWDRGFDKDAKQVWGAEKGGYQFIRQQE